MNKYISIFLVLVFITGGYFLFSKDKENSKIEPVLSTSTTTPNILETKSEEVVEKSDIKTFVFDSFHGSTNISHKFKFIYPANWNNDGQYFSPQKIEYYSLYNVKAPVFFDLIRVDIFNDTELKYQIDNSKRKSPDMVGKIDGKDFRRYDLIDYGSYGGESAGRVIVYIGSEIKIDDVSYYLVFYWEEKPLVVSISGNDPKVFEDMVKSLKFNK